MDNEQKTAMKADEIMKDMQKAGKKGAVLRVGATTLIACERQSEIVGGGRELGVVPSFSITKIHNGDIIKEAFV